MPPVLRTRPVSSTPSVPTSQVTTPAAQAGATADDLVADHAAELAASHRGDPDFMLSLARGLQVIRAFSEHRRELTMSQISQKTGLSRAAVRRCLHTLKVLGYVGDDGRLFSLRPHILTLGHAYLASTPLAVSAQPYLDQVSQAVHESCSAAVLEGDEILYICRAAVSRIMSISLMVGSRLPAHCSSMGRVLLAHLPPHELDAYFKRARLVALTERTLTSVPRLRRLLAEVREAGFAVIDQELELGLRSVAVPVTDSRGRVIAAMNVSTQASRVSVAQMLAEFLPPLRRAAQGLSAVQLG